MWAATTVWRWWLGNGSRRPGTWVLAAALVLLCPLAVLVGPFPAAGVDPTWVLAGSWSLPVGLIGASAALFFLGANAELFDRLAPRTRWGGEIGALLIAPLALQGFLGIGAMLAGRNALSELPGWLLVCVVEDVHVAALGVLALRLALSGALRIAALWAVVWVVPALLGPVRLTIFMDPSWHSRVLSRFGESPESALGSFATVAGLLAAGALAHPPRTAAGLR